MFINPISAASTPKYSNTTSFKKGLNPEVARNQYKILLIIQIKETNCLILKTKGKPLKLLQYHRT